MSRYLAIDLGEKRIGVAISDPSRTIAQPLVTLKNRGFKKWVAELRQLCDKYEVIKVIVGVPLTMKGRESQKTREVREIIEELKKRLPAAVEEFDERLTTLQAHATLRTLGKKPHREKSRVDQMAAVHLLQTVLDKEKGGRSS